MIKFSTIELASPASRRARRWLLGTAAILLPVGSAHAEEGVMAEGEESAIVVTGERPIAESEAAALEVQKNADSLVAVAASDSVGRLPDQNIAQATGRLPGVAVERDQGQARYISLRGAPNYWTTLSFDGINVVSPEGRDARFDSVPSAIAGKIIVSKAVTPDMPGETVSGNVNVVTRSAFDYDALHFAGKAGIGFAELGDRREYETSAVLSNRFKAGDGEIGVLLSGSFYERNMITDNFENDWTSVSADNRAGGASRLWVLESENKLYRLTRRNWSVSGRLDWKPDADNTISLRSIYTKFSDDEARDNYRFDLDNNGVKFADSSGVCPTPSALSSTTLGYADVCVGNTPTKGTLYGIDISQRSTLRAFRQSIFTNTLAGDHTFGDGWQLSWLGNYTESKDDRSVIGEATWDSQAELAVGYDFTDPNRSILTLYKMNSGAIGDRVIDADSFTKTLSRFDVLDAVDTTKAYTGKLVVSRETALFGGEAIFKAGFQFDQRTKTIDESRIRLSKAADFGKIGLSTNYNSNSITQPFLGKIPMGYTFHYFDTMKISGASESAREQFTFSPQTDNIYDVREQVYAGFLMGTVKYDWGSLVGGVRVEHVKNRGIATATIGKTPEVKTVQSSQTLAFPSLHLNYNVDETKKFRLSFNTGAARADYDVMRPNFVVDDGTQTISGGNPDIKPERAYGVDAYFEWFLRPQGYLMAGVFYKKVQDVLYKQTGRFGSDALGAERKDYTYSTTTNGGEGRIYGFEVAAQMQLEPWTTNLGLPDWMGGFGLSANVTVNDSEVTKPALGGFAARKMRLPGTSDLVYNVGGYYEKYGLSLRLQYQRRSAWMDGVADDLSAGGDTYWAADDELDFSARYAVTKNFEIYFDAANLLNKPGRRYVDPSGLLNAKGIAATSSDKLTMEWERFGRRYSGGIRVNF